jgi:hypothetical protein
MAANDNHGPVKIEEISCECCGAPLADREGAIFALPGDGTIQAWCSPGCAAQQGKWPWSSADLVTRASWPTS